MDRGTQSASRYMVVSHAAQENRTRANEVSILTGTTHSVDLENVQRAATRLIPSIRYLSYKQRLRALDLPSLGHRRLYRDMINVYRLLHSMSNLDPAQFFTMNVSSRTRGHPLKLCKQ